MSHAMREKLTHFPFQIYIQILVLTSKLLEMLVDNFQYLISSLGIVMVARLVINFAEQHIWNRFFFFCWFVTEIEYFSFIKFSDKMFPLFQHYYTYSYISV